MSSRNDLRDAQRAIVAALSQHAAYNYRASSAVVNRINDEIDHLARDLAVALSDRLESLTPSELQAFVQGRYTTSRLKALRAEIDAWSKALDEMIGAEWSKSARDLAGYEAAYVAGLMGKTFDGLPKHMPKADAVLRKANRTPIMGRFVSDMLSDIAPAQRERIYATIRQGIAAGQSNGEIIRALRGTPALKYRDGLMQAAKRDVERLVRTARNHVSNIAYEDAYRALGVTHVVWVATLEGRTCLAAGERVDTPDGPKPIEQIATGEYVIGGSGVKRKVTATMTNKTKRLCRVKLSNGKTVVCTPDHLVWTGAEWIEIGELKAGQLLPSAL